MASKKKLYVALNDDNNQTPNGDYEAGNIQESLDDIQSNSDEEQSYTIYELVPVKKVKTGTLVITDVATGKQTTKKDKLY